MNWLIEENYSTISELLKLKPKLANASPSARIKFASLVLKRGLYLPVVHNEFYDCGISERDFDTCFEMHDGDAVRNGIVAEALKDDAVKNGIKEQGGTTWDSWLAAYKEMETQQDMFC